MPNDIQEAKCNPEVKLYPNPMILLTRVVTLPSQVSDVQSKNTQIAKVELLI